MRKPLLLGVLVGLALTVSAQNSSKDTPFSSTIQVRNLVTQPVNESNITVLKGNIHPLARPQFDIGGAPPNLPLDRMLLVLKRSPEQDVALKTLLDQQQDKSSQNFHRWLTPDEFGSAFGPSDPDIQAVISWLLTHGFQVNRVARGRTMIEFSGNQAQLQQAFHTSIHRYAVNGELHWANDSDPQIPAALAPVVAGVHTLHNFQKKPMLVRTNQQFAITHNPGSTPTVTGAGGQHFLAPGDFNKIYNVPPTLTGLGATIAVVGRSNINAQDISDFQSIFLGAPINPPVLVLNGEDPGNLGASGDPVGQNEEAEAVLDNTWSSSLATGATVKFVVSATTDTTDGVDLSELYIVDNNLADVMTESFGSCEAFFTNAQAQGVELLAEQAAAEGITYTLSTGDTGSAGCARGSTIGPASISVLASTRFNVAVGGTQFNDTANPAKYWNSSQAAIVTALSYIPENVWNESSGTNLAATGGGVSTIFPKPSWQTGVTANDSFRDIPDVSLAAAAHTPYLICFEQACTQQGLVNGIAGTSASAPSFAAIMAMIFEKTGSRQGQADYVLYKLAATQSSLTTCNGSSTTTLPASTCIFNDVTSGTNAVAGVAGFAAAKGYDRATGLGSVNVTNLANAWSTAQGSFKGSATTLSLTPFPISITHGQSVNVQIGVAPSGGATGTPTGDVSLLKNGATGPSIDTFNLIAGAITGSTLLLPGGSYSVIAHYPGDGTFGLSDSAPVAVTVLPEGSTVIETAESFDSAGNLFNLAGTSTPYGNPIYLKADVHGSSGIATGTVDFADGAATLANVLINSQGDANTAQGLFAVPAGLHSVVAKYSGDPSFNASNSAAIPFTVTKATTTTSVQSSQPSINVGGTVTLTATVNTTSGGRAPGGTVTFFSGTTQLGSPVPITTQTDGSGSIQTGAVLAASATYLMNSSALPGGKDNITAAYNGDSNYSGSTSTPTVVNVADFTLSSSPTSVTISSPGKTGSLTLTVTGIQPNFAGSVGFAPTSCSGLPSLATCSFSAASVVNGGTTVLTINTTAPQSATLLGAPGKMGLWATSLGGLFAGVFLVGMPSRRRWSTTLRWLAFALCLTIVGCGGGKSSTPPIIKPGTPMGTFSVVVTGTSSSGATSSLPFALVVQ